MKLKPLSEEIKKQYLLDWEASQLHLTPASFPMLTSLALFGNDLPLEVEIGCGSGEYLCQLALESPKTNFLGIEVSRRAAQAAALRAASLPLNNLRILRADFKLLILLMPHQGWKAVYLHFPDPPHRRKDSKHLIFDRIFLDAMARALVPAGQLSVVSDRGDFFERMLELAESHAQFVKASESAFEPEIKSRFQLAWERKGVSPRRFLLKKLSP